MSPQQHHLRELLQREDKDMHSLVSVSGTQGKSIGLPSVGSFVHEVAAMPGFSLRDG